MATNGTSSRSPNSGSNNNNNNNNNFHPTNQPSHPSLSRQNSNSHSRQHQQSQSQSQSHIQNQQSQQSQQQQQPQPQPQTSSMSTPPGILRERERDRERGEPSSTGARRMNTDIPVILPHERVFPIQIGGKMFKLSGASISSDAPSYFSQYFKCQLNQAEENGNDASQIRTLYIDRDPVTFQDISLHLQGYHVAPRDGSHFVKMFADAQFYSLPRLISQLYEESIFISIGHRDFQIPRELFSDPGNSPNYFSLGFAVFFSSPTEVFPGLSRDGLLRPPSIMPPSVPNRSADTFAELLHLLRGYPLSLRSEDHRAELLRDCRYFHLKGLEQKLIKHSISFNLARNRSEITLRIDDVRQSGISIVADSPTSSSTSDSALNSPTPEPGTPIYNTSSLTLAHIHYARPFADSSPSELILEIGAECTRLHLSSMRCEFFGDGKARISRLFEVIATKLNLPTTQPLGLLMKGGGARSAPASPGNTGLSEDWVRCVVDGDTFVRLDGREWKDYGILENRTEEVGEGAESSGSSVGAMDDFGGFGEPSRKRRRVGSHVSGHVSSGGDVRKAESWVIKTGQWRLRIQNSRRDGKAGVECVLVAIKLDAVSGEFGRNAQRGFLGE